MKRLAVVGFAILLGCAPSGAEAQRTNHLTGNECMVPSSTSATQCYISRYDFDDGTRCYVYHGYGISCLGRRDQ